MPDIDVTIDQLLPDPENPRTGRAADRDDSIQRMVDLQKNNLANLALNIAEHGLSPIDRMMVIGPDENTGEYTVVEGNRRATALILMDDPSHLDQLNFSDKRLLNKFQKAALRFSRKDVEPISVFLAKDRPSTRRWVELRHAGRDKGRGVSPWNGVEAARFAKGEDAPIVAASDFLLHRAQLSETEIEALDDMPWSSFERFIDSPKLREKLGLRLNDGRLEATIEPEEIAKTLREIAFMVTRREKPDGNILNSRTMNTVDQRIEILESMPSKYQPDLSLTIEPIPLSELKIEKKTKPKRKNKRRTVKDPLARDKIIGRSLPFKVSRSKAEKILHEMGSISVVYHTVTIAILLRSFIELSVKQFLRKNGDTKNDELYKKIKRAADIIKIADPNADLGPIALIISSGQHKNAIWKLNSVVHDDYAFPTHRELNGFWDEIEPFLAHLWRSK